MYHIVVGEARPQTVKIGTIERGTGSSIVKERGETLARRGDTGFPNGCRIWAARLVDGKIPKNDKGEFEEVSPTDPRYKGKLKRLKWGSAGGSLINVRYLKGYPSLDVLYQENRLNFKVDETNENSADIYMLMFPTGENDIDERTDELLVEHLQGHAYNRNSDSKDPNHQTAMFYEKSFEQQDKMESLELDIQFDAATIVREAGEGGDSLGKLKNLFTIVRTVTDEEPEDNKKYAYLKMLANKRPAQFIKSVQDYKVKVSNTFEKLKSYELVDLTTEGTIVAWEKNKKKEIIMTDLPGNGDEMFDYLLANFTDPKVFDATFTLTKISDKIK